MGKLLTSMTGPRKSAKRLAGYVQPNGRESEFRRFSPHLDRARFACRPHDNHTPAVKRIAARILVAGHILRIRISHRGDFSYSAYSE